MLAVFAVAWFVGALAGFFCINEVIPRNMEETADETIALRIILSIFFWPIVVLVYVVMSLLRFITK